MKWLVKMPDGKEVEAAGGDASMAASEAIRRHLPDPRSVDEKPFSVEVRRKTVKYASDKETRTIYVVAHCYCAHLCSAARALVRRGLACTYLTGHYAATETGRAIVEEWAKRTGTVLKPLY